MDITEETPVIVLPSASALQSKTPLLYPNISIASVCYNSKVAKYENIFVFCVHYFVAQK